MSDDPEQRRFDWVREETETRLERLSPARERPVASAGRGRTSCLRARWRRCASCRPWRESVASRRNIPFRRIRLGRSAGWRCRRLGLLRRPSSRAFAGLGSSSSRTSRRFWARSRRRSRFPRRSFRRGAIRHHGGKPSRMVVLFLESVLAAACAKHQIDPELVGSSSQLRAVVSWNEGGPAGRADASAAQRLARRGMRRAVAGGAGRGRISLRIQRSAVGESAGGGRAAVGGLAVAGRRREFLSRLLGFPLLEADRDVRGVGPR